jgi:DNA topoisomerase-1
MVNATLRYVDDSRPGITRKRSGRYWMYFDPDGARITDRDEIDRLNAIGLPPAYERCWLSPFPDGHIQAIGYDARGRRQYRYHPDFRARKDVQKYERLAAFGAALPKLRRKVEADMKDRDITLDTVVAAVVRLIDSTHMRVGNEEYAKANKSFGATTLRNRHARVTGGKLTICYAGKHGIMRTCTVTDRNLARIARRTQELPGQHLFECVDSAGNVRPVTSGDVNAYVREGMGEEFTAKDFRTWGASVIAWEELAKRAGKPRIDLKSVIEPVAEALGNTAAISRKSYVHPALIEAAKGIGTGLDNVAAVASKPHRATKYLSAAERGLIDFLQAASKGKRRPRARGLARARRAD